MKLFSLLDIQYKSFISQVEAYLSKALSEFNKSFGSNTVFGQIINVVGNAIQNVMLYIEDALVEQNKYTAQRKKSLWGLASLSGYNADLGKAAVANLKLTFNVNNSNAYNVIIRDKMQLTCTQNGLIYSLKLPQETIILNMYTDTSAKYFTAVQGMFETQRFIATGGQFYTVGLNYVANIDTEFLTVLVNNEKWEYAPSIYDMHADGKQYTYRNGINGELQIIFGNGAHGRPLFANDVIDVEYLMHDGTNGNLNPENEAYFVFNELLLDTNGDSYDGNALFNVTLSEKDPILSGSNAETLQQVREMIGLNSRSLVLASPENYKLLISRFGFCGYNRTWSDSDSIKSMIMKNFSANVSSGADYFNLVESDFMLTDNQIQSIKNYIEKSGTQLAAATYEIIRPQLRKYAMWTYISLKSSKYNKDIIKEQIRECVGNFFTNHIQSDKFIPKSDLIHAIKTEVEGVDGVDIYFISQKNEEAIRTGQYTEVIYKKNELTGQYVSQVSTVKLYGNENPNLGLDEHGNIYLKSDFEFPVLMGGWSYVNVNGDISDTIDEPLIIIFEDLNTNN